MSAASFTGVVEDDIMNQNRDIMNPSRERKPSKGILKNSSSFDTAEPHQRKEMKWDEMNILATFHPLDKDYGHMKVDEPPTPYSGSLILDDDDDDLELGNTASSKRRSGSFDRSVTEKLDADTLASRLAGSHEPTVMLRRSSQSSDDEDDNKGQSSKGQERNREFEQKRRLHYNEYHAMRLAKHLMEQDALENDEGDDENDNNKDNDIPTSPISRDTVNSETLDTSSDVQMSSCSGHTLTYTN